jgi:hypothetical protein
MSEPRPLTPYEFSRPVIGTALLLYLSKYVESVGYIDEYEGLMISEYFVKRNVIICKAQSNDVR